MPFQRFSVAVRSLGLRLAMESLRPFMRSNCTERATSSQPSLPTRRYTMCFSGTFSPVECSVVHSPMPPAAVTSGSCG